VTHYRATYQFDGRAWVCQFVEPDIATFGRTLAAARAHARSLLAVHLEVDDLVTAGVEIDDLVKLPEGVDIELDALLRQRAEAEKLRHDVAEATRRAAASLRAAGLSTRDVGDLIGVSAARVGQLETDRSTGDLAPEFEIQYRRVKRVRKLGEAIIPADEPVGT
jgi:predicted RNase H-like HicB family nuclease